ncbi:MAG: HAMP domain-containing sensor histidine kinase, partial [Planctomycetota bacterium]|nr:HAMP domain-containing sensor histidine kinase [Planctomycetota bacterium]
RILYHTFGRQPENELLAASVARRESSGSLEWEVDGVPHLGRYWHAFLRPQYGVDLWVLQSRSQAEAFAVGRSFERGFWLTAACTLLCVVLVGLVTMRRTLDPIMSLRDATRMLGGGALDVRVDIEAKDEFGELGLAFNDMAARLQENIAQRERTERELVTSRDAALAAVKAKAEFVTNVSHEFRTPMAEILGAAEILTQIGDDPDGGVREEFSAIALHGAKRLARLLDDVLELGETGNSRRGQLDVSATVGAAVEGLPREVRARVHVRADHGLPSLSGDEQGLGSTWRRLLDNAAKFSASSAPIDVDVERAGDDVVVRVRDQGVGIAPADLAAVFEPFSQVGRDQLVDKAQGTGLGLALAKAVVEAHGGAISAESTLGAGTTFTVRLPVTPLQAAAR